MRGFRIDFSKKYNRCHRDPDAQMPEGNPAIPGKENK